MFHRHGRIHLSTLLAYAIMATPALAQEIYCAYDSWEQYGGHSLKRIVLNNAPQVDGVIPDLGAWITSVQVDESAGKVYWIDTSGRNRMVARANLDGTDVETLLTLGPEYNYIDSMALDEVHGTIYWAGQDGLHRADLDGSNLQPLLEEHVFGVAVDPDRGFLYWSASPNSTLYRGQLDGTLLGIVAVNVRTPITVNRVDGSVYWAGTNGAMGISRVDPLGTNQQEVLVISEPDYFIDSLGVDGQRGRLYWAELYSRQAFSADLDGSDVQLLGQFPELHPGSMAVGVQTGLLYWGSKDPTGIQLIEPNQPVSLQSVVTLADLPAVTSLSVDVITGTLYWIDWLGFPWHCSVKRGALDGSSFEELIRGEPDYESDGPQFQPQNIQLDLASGHIYWARHGITNSFAGIQRADLDGTNIVNIVDAFALPNPGRPSALALSLVDGLLYWAESNGTWQAASSLVRRANLDGSNVVDVLTTDAVVHAMAVDTGGGKMYWIEYLETHLAAATPDGPGGGAAMKVDVARVKRADLDGSNIELLFQHSQPFFYSFQYALALDLVGGKVYWGVDNLWRANLDGSNIEQLMTFEELGGGPRELFVVNAAAKAMGSRYLSATISEDNVEVAIRVTSPEVGCLDNYLDASGALTDQPVYRPAYSWRDISIHDARIVPNTSYAFGVRTVEGPTALVLNTMTPPWGDVVAPFGVVNFLDVSAIVHLFRGLPYAPPIAAADLWPANPDGIANFLDISACVQAFQGFPYPGDPCP